jgi:hypothetical protein
MEEEEVRGSDVRLNSFMSGGAGGTVLLLSGNAGDFSLWSVYVKGGNGASTGSNISVTTGNQLHGSGGGGGSGGYAAATSSVASSNQLGGMPGNHFLQCQPGVPGYNGAFTDQFNLSDSLPSMRLFEYECPSVSATMTVSPSVSITCSPSPSFTPSVSITTSQSGSSSKTSSQTSSPSSSATDSRSRKFRCSNRERITAHSSVRNSNGICFGDEIIFCIRNFLAHCL